jgi:hypothetical protein
MLAVAQVLGHEHLDVTARHFTQAAEDAAKRTKEALEQALFGTWFSERWCQNGAKKLKHNGW